MTSPFNSWFWKGKSTANDLTNEPGPIILCSPQISASHKQCAIERDHLRKLRSTMNSQHLLRNFSTGGVLYCIVATPQKKSRDANGAKHGWRSMTNVLHVQEPSWRKVTASAWFLPLKLSTSGFQPVNPVSSGACKTLSSWDEVFVSWSSVVFSWYILWSMFVGGMATWGFPDLLGHVLLGPFKAWETCCGVAEGSHDGRSHFRGREPNESRSTFFHEWLVFFRHPSEKYGG